MAKREEQPRSCSIRRRGERQQHYAAKNTTLARSPHPQKMKQYASTQRRTSLQGCDPSRSPHRSQPGSEPASSAPCANLGGGGSASPPAVLPSAALPHHSATASPPPPPPPRPRPPFPRLSPRRVPQPPAPAAGRPPRCPGDRAREPRPDQRGYPGARGAAPGVRKAGGGLSCWSTGQWRGPGEARVFVGCGRASAGRGWSPALRLAAPPRPGTFSFRRAAVEWRELDEKRGTPRGIVSGRCSDSVAAWVAGLTRVMVTVKAVAWAVLAAVVVSGCIPRTVWYCTFWKMITCTFVISVETPLSWARPHEQGGDPHRREQLATLGSSCALKNLITAFDLCRAQPPSS